MGNPQTTPQKSQLFVGTPMFVARAVLSKDTVASRNADKSGPTSGSIPFTIHAIRAVTNPVPQTGRHSRRPVAAATAVYPQFRRFRPVAVSTAVDSGRTQIFAHSGCSSCRLQHAAGNRSGRADARVAVPWCPLLSSHIEYPHSLSRTIIFHSMGSKYPTVLDLVYKLIAGVVLISLSSITPHKLKTCRLGLVVTREGMPSWSWRCDMAPFAVDILMMTVARHALTKLSIIFFQM